MVPMALLCLLLPLVQGFVSLSKDYEFGPPYQIDLVDEFTGEFKKIASLADGRPMGNSALRNDNTIVYGVVFSDQHVDLSTALNIVDLSTGKIQEGQNYSSYYFSNIAFDKVTNEDPQDLRADRHFRHTHRPLHQQGGHTHVQHSLQRSRQSSRAPHARVVREQFHRSTHRPLCCDDGLSIEEKRKEKKREMCVCVCCVILKPVRYTSFNRCVCVCLYFWTRIYSLCQVSNIHKKKKKN